MQDTARGMRTTGFEVSFKCRVLVGAERSKKGITIVMVEVY